MLGRSDSGKHAGPAFELRINLEEILPDLLSGFCEFVGGGRLGKDIVNKEILGVVEQVSRSVPAVVADVEWFVTFRRTGGRGDRFRIGTVHAHHPLRDGLSVGSPRFGRAGDGRREGAHECGQEQEDPFHGRRGIAPCIVQTFAAVSTALR